MERRELLANLFGLGRRPSLGDGTVLKVEGGIEPYAEPLTLEDVLHLFRRVGFAATMDQARSHVGRQAVDVVEEILGTGNEPDPEAPGPWVDSWTENPLGADLQTRNGIYRAWGNNMRSLADWWLGRMAGDATAIEKLTLFWSSHWTTEYSFDNTNSLPQLLYRQLVMFRRMRNGDLRDLALEVTLDPGMLYYLGGTYNTAGAPNENYARELLELYLTGIGWYTEGDVQEGARVLTGWRTQRYSDEPAPNDKYKTWFDAGAHDTGAKQFLGQTIAARTQDNNTAFQVKFDEVYRLIQIIFEVRPEAVSSFIAEKLYRYYVYSSAGDVDPEFVAALAEQYRSADFNLRSLYKTLFSSAHFFDPAVRGAQIKTPMEYMAGLMRQLGTSANDIWDWAYDMDQSVMDPPTVAGWPGYRSWISTNTYPIRRTFARDLIQRMSDAAVNTWIRTFDDHDDAHKFTANVVRYLLPVPVSEERQNYYLQALLQGAPDYDWPVILDDASAAAKRTRDLLITISRAPDFQLC